MGGPKKRSLKQIEKQQKLQNKSSKTSEKTNKVKTADSGEFSFERITDEDLKELVNTKTLTPYAVAIKYNVKISTAKDILKTLQERKTIQQVAKGRRFSVYKSIKN